MYRPAEDEYPAYYHNYILGVYEEDILQLLERQAAELRSLFTSIPVEQETYRYAEGKWSIKELLGHIVDAERIFATRALRFARNDMKPLPGFDENIYVQNAGFDHRSMFSLLEEFAGLRKANAELFSSMTEEMLLRRGEANGKPISVRAIIYVVAGHANHHMNILRERYLSALAEQES